MRRILITKDAIIRAGLLIGFFGGLIASAQTSATPAPIVPVSSSPCLNTNPLPTGCISGPLQEPSNMTWQQQTVAPINFCAIENGSAVNAYKCRNSASGFYGMTILWKGVQLSFTAFATNTGPTTLTIDNLSPLTIKKWKGSSLVDLEAGDIPACGTTCPIVSLVYDGTYLVDIVPSPRDVRSFGAKCDGATNDQTAIDLAINSGQSLLWPQGATCVYSNANGPTVYTGLTNVTWYAPGGVTIVFTTPTKLGWTVQGASHFAIDGFTFDFNPVPTVRQSGAPLYFNQCTDVSATNITSRHSPAQGLSFNTVTGLRVSNVFVNNSLADGVYHLLDTGVTENNIHTDTTGDDSIEFLASSGVLSNLYMRNSAAKFIACDGCTQTTFTGIDGDTAGVQGIQVYGDSYVNNIVPDDVHFINGTIRNTGTGSTGNPNAIEINSAKRVYISDMALDTASTIAGINYGNGLLVNSATAQVWLSNTHIENMTGNGVNVSTALLFSQSNVDITATAGTCDAVISTQTVLNNHLTCRNTSTAYNLHRAFDFENNGSVNGSGFIILDTQATPTGYTFLETGTTGKAIFGDVQCNVPNGSCSYSTLR